MTDPIEQRLRAAAWQEQLSVRPPALTELRARSRRQRAKAFAAPLAIAVVVALGVFGVDALVGGPDPRPEPRPDAIAAPPRASVDLAGIRLTLEVDRSTVRIGDVATATITVQNTTDKPIGYTGDGCLDLAPTLINVEQQVIPGRQWTGADAAFKAAAVEPRPAVEAVVPKDRFDIEVGCGDVLLGDTIAVGETRTQRLFWRAAMPEGGRPAGHATMTSTFQLGTVNGASLPTRRPAVSVALRVEAVGSAPLSQAEAVDVALTDAAFQRWLGLAQAPGTRPFSFYDRGEHQWTVGRARDTPTPGSSGYVVIDAVTGKVVSRTLD